MLGAIKNIVWLPAIRYSREKRRSLIIVILLAEPIVMDRRHLSIIFSTFPSTSWPFLSSLINRGEDIANEMFLIKIITNRLRPYNLQLTTISPFSDLHELPKFSVKGIHYINFGLQLNLCYNFMQKELVSYI